MATKVGLSRLQLVEGEEQALALLLRQLAAGEIHAAAVGARADTLLPLAADSRRFALLLMQLLHALDGVALVVQQRAHARAARRCPAGR